MTNVTLEMVDCPVCNGTGLVPLSESERRYSWNAGKVSCACRNCGGQTMTGVGTGKVYKNKDGKPCIHEYTGRQAGRCYTIYTCIHCPTTFGIDSGD